jgi:ribosomal-protein-alanine N-acetyltransferase
MRLREGTTPEDGVVPRATYVGTLEATVFPNRSAYIAYTVFVPFWRQGYAREGCAHMLRHLLEDYGVRVVVAEMDTRNAASVSLVEALGFERVGTTLGADHFKGSVSDEHRYELRVDEEPGAK